MAYKTNGRICLEVFPHPSMAIIIIASIISTIITSITMINNLTIKWQGLLGGLPPPQVEVFCIHGSQVTIHPIMIIIMMRMMMMTMKRMIMKIY